MYVYGIFKFFFKMSSYFVLDWLKNFCYIFLFFLGTRKDISLFFFVLFWSCILDRAFMSTCPNFCFFEIFYIISDFVFSTHVFANFFCLITIIIKWFWKNWLVKHSYFWKMYLLWSTWDVSRIFWCWNPMHACPILIFC